MPMQITDVGRVRDVKHTWSEGAWECPFCFSGYDPSRGPCRGQAQGYREDCGKGEHCQNPACFANPHYPVERAREAMAAEERRRAEEASRAEIAEFRKRYAEEQAAERRAKTEAIRKEAESRGACIRCALKRRTLSHPKVHQASHSLSAESLKFLPDFRPTSTPAIRRYPLICSCHRATAAQSARLRRE